MTAQAMDEFGIDDGDDKAVTITDRFKADKRKYRVSFAAWKEKEDGTFDMGSEDDAEEDSGRTPRFLSSNRNYIQGVGYVLNRGRAWTKIANGEKPRLAIGTVIVVWPTDHKGNIQKERLKDLDAIEVKMWVFSKDKYRDISSQHKEWPLNKHDLTLDCTETTYQRMTFSPCRQSLLAKFATNPNTKELYKQIEERAKACWENLPEAIGKDMTVDQILAKKSGDSGDAADTGMDAVATEDVDNMLDGMI